MEHMNNSDQLIVFSIDEQRYALPLPNIERIVRMVEITPLPKAPENVSGIINVQGRIIPVLNLRQHFGLSGREIDLNDQLIIAHTKRRWIAFMADTVGDVVEIMEKEVVKSEEILPGMEYVLGLIKKDDGLIHILDIDAILSSAAIDIGGKI